MDTLSHINREQMKIMDPYKLLEIIKPFWKNLGFDISGFQMIAKISIDDGRQRPDNAPASRMMTTL